MSVTFRVIALSLIVTVLMGGPLAPLVGAQQPPPPPPPAPQPDLFQESIKTTQGPAVNTVDDGSGRAYDVAAGFADVLYVPGKAIICAAGVGIGAAIFVLTFGSAYRGAAEATREGCGGKWVLRGSDLRPTETPSQPFPWE